MNHIRSLYGRFFLRIMAVCYLLAGLLFVRGSKHTGGKQSVIRMPHSHCRDCTASLLRNIAGSAYTGGQTAKQQ